MPVKKPAAPQQATLKDIAELVGVSINTVSGVLNPRSIAVRVSAVKRRAILDAAQRLNYRRNVAASRLAGGQTRTIGILMESLTHAFSAPVADAFEQEVVRRGYQCFVGCTRYDGLQKKNYIERFLEHGVNGLLMTAFWNNPEIKEALHGVLSTELPIVFVDYIWGEHPGPLVCGNHYQGGELLAQHLIEMGHRSMLFLATQQDIQTKSVKDRIRGVRSVLAAEGLAPEALRLFSANYELSDRYTRSLVSDSIVREIQGPHRPTVVVCANDLTAYGLIIALTEKGLRVPDDIAVTGYDDLDHSFWHSLGFTDNACLPYLVSLTTIRQPFEEIGRMAANTLIRQIEGETVSRRECQYADVSLVVRESSRLPSPRLEPLAAGKM
jgi:LacI family transcriptional regulator